MHMTKPILWLLCLCTAMPFGAKAQSTRTYMFNFHKNDFTVETLNGDTCFLSSTEYDVSSEFDPTLPELPVIYVNLLLPSDSTYASFSYTTYYTSYISNILLTNCSEIVSYDEPSVPSNEWYPQTTYNPSVEYLGSTSMSGYQVASFKIKPCKYYASTKRLYFYRIKFNLTMQPTTVVPRNGGKRGYFDRAEMSHRVWNTEQIDEWYPLDSSAVYPSAPDNGPILKDRYIIVTNNTLKPAFQPLIEWKRMKGLDAEIITRETINASATVSGDTGIHKIKHYLKNLYDNDPDRDNKDFFLLLGGDVNIVPTAYCKSFAALEPIASDMYYACVSGSNWKWDNNGNNILAERNDSASYINDFYVSRASVRNLSQASVFVNKVISYEANPPLQSNWGDSLLFIRHDDKLKNNKKLYQQQIKPYSNDTIIGLYYTSQPINEFQREVKSHLEGAFSYVDEISHGNHSKWIISNDSTYILSRNEADSLSTIFPKIIVSASCYSNGFDRNENLSGPSLSETLMRNSNSGITAYVGSSRKGYRNLSYDYNYYVFSHLFNKRFIMGLFHINADSMAMDYPVEKLKVKNLGKLVDYAKKDFLYSYNYSNNANNLKLLQSIATLGDPEMPIYTQHPMLFDSVSCQIDTVNNKVIISTGVADTRLHIISNGKLYETTGTTYELPMMSKDSIEFVLTKQNYIPTLFTPFKTTKYIQNETISENTLHTGYDYIKVGRNVDITKPFGNVVVSSGKSLMLKANKEIEIRNNIEVQSGAEFIIDVEP